MAHRRSAYSPLSLPFIQVNDFIQLSDFVKDVGTGFKLSPAKKERKKTDKEKGSREKIH